MTDFGFNIHKELLIDHDRPSPAYEELLKKVPSICICMACGSCSGTCAASSQSGSGFRKLIMLLRNGMYDQIVKALEYCQFCGKCSLVCPRGINTRKAIIEMRKYFKVQCNDVV